MSIHFRCANCHSVFAGLGTLVGHQHWAHGRDPGVEIERVQREGRDWYKHDRLVVQANKDANPERNRTNVSTPGGPRDAWPIDLGEYVVGTGHNRAAAEHPRYGPSQRR